MNLPAPRIVFLIIVLLGGAIASSAQPATFSGRVTEQTTGQGIANAVVVGEGNVTGTRVAVTDAQGNYSLPFGANTNIRLRAYKTTYTFDPLMVVFVSSGPPLSGPFQRDFAGTSFPVRIITMPPVLLTEDNSLNALAVDGVVRTRDPFTVANDRYFGADQRTRMTLLLVDLDLYPNQGKSLSLITVQAQGQTGTFHLIPEDLRKVPGFSWMTQLIVRVPPELAGAGETNVTVNFQGQFQPAFSAKVRFQ
jgi:hypothetical protein